MGKAQDHVWRTEQPRRDGEAVAEGAGLRRESVGLWRSQDNFSESPSIAKVLGTKHAIRQMILPSEQ